MTFFKRDNRVDGRSCIQIMDADPFTTTPSRVAAVFHDDMAYTCFILGVRAAGHNLFDNDADQFIVAPDLF